MEEILSQYVSNHHNLCQLYLKLKQFLKEKKEKNPILQRIGEN